MVKAEKAFKWGIAIVVVFGIINALYFFDIVIGLKILLPILCVFMIGSILLQSGKGGGLAAIGGLGDQAAFGTRTSTFLSKVTYLIGGAFIVTTIFLFKASIPTKSIKVMPEPAGQHAHEHHEHEEAHEHAHMPQQEEKEGSASEAGMKTVEEQTAKPVQESQPHQPETQGKPPQEQPAGMAPVKEEESRENKPEANE